MTPLILLGAYLMGSIPFSYLVARVRGVDVRQVGSGNVGATNVMRSAGLTLGLLAFVLDFCKGAAATQIALSVARVYRTPPQATAIAAAAGALAVIGHVFPVWLGFRGGKGVATGAGAMLPLAPVATAAAIALFAIVLVVSRYVSLGSLVGATSLAAISFFVPGNLYVSLAACVSAGLIVLKHRGNIERLRRGGERRLGSKPEPTSEAGFTPAERPPAR